ncbi:hypothetical protein PC116_g2695 [Phytophthora cactorum]|uniref:Uncharacterized protein n=1 Tax=Phytophthora cactorum TaxID=29920 RepID=A0A8T1LJ22_9STRA|nr:hypothetical protein PC114_g24898 [Phytophthora cactorum]KAG2896437.1 hypothetical protein PC117_g23010 [Phytophthora cactorum]KAG2968514.1 hypothetical protein PC119_g24189 [Phytophthora cactorum]KAG3031912.1 hypothetical protein PC120_g2813 [Phytophthora cactorum]KAG3179731.1 hypothetical protein C6341_g7355 [Phytophthora cactorum]
MFEAAAVKLQNDLPISAAELREVEGFVQPQNSHVLMTAGRRTSPSSFSAKPRNRELQDTRLHSTILSSIALHRRAKPAKGSSLSASSSSPRYVRLHYQRTSRR